ncbi:MAG: hypothetical protein EU532_11570 [Promethearchaeota archaeon]|nr:MAG: hypothetical protein EU532_11570 [Candidatus Lokiarchaeota archaeon]
MEKEHLDTLLSKIKSIEKKNSDFESYLSNINILSRNRIIKEIISDIIKNNKFFQSIHLTDESVCLAIEGSIEVSGENYIEELILKIQNEPTKKIIILREFLNKLEGISEGDLNVLLKSLNDKNYEDLHKELLNLINIFKLKSLK